MHGIYFTNNTCINCGKQNTIHLFDTYNRPIERKGFPSLFAKCEECGEQYITIMNVASNSIQFRDRKSSINRFTEIYCSNEEK